MAEPRDDDFFIGYLPLAQRTRRFLWTVAGALLLATLGLGVLASSQREAPAPTTQHPASTLVGRIEARAYGILWTVRDGRAQPVLLSRGGKFGAPDAVKKLAGQLAQLSGLLVERDGYQLLEVQKIEAPPPLDAHTRSLLDELPRKQLGVLTVRGEIVDIKCWLGRMKPGDGRTHRACAQLCIAGGIPPVLIARAPDGRARHYVLTDRDGGAVNEAVLPYVAEPVELRGALELVGELLFLRIDGAQIRRL